MATLSSTTSWADNDPLSPALLNAKRDVLIANIEAVNREAGLYVNVLSFGALGDGVADDTASLQSAIESAVDAGSRTVYFPRTAAYYRLTSGLTVSGSVRLIGDGELRQSSSNAALVNVSASSVVIDGLTLTNSQYASFGTGEFGINVTGQSGQARSRNVAIRNCTIRTVGAEAIRLKWVESAEVSHCHISNCFYAGVLMWGVGGAQVTNNVITGITGTPNAYGVTATRGNDASLTSDPRSTDVVIAYNVITDIPAWNGIDVHGGVNVAIQGNTLRAVDKPIWVVSSSSGAVETWAARDVTIVANTLDSGVTDGSADVGIVVSGAASGVGGVVEYAENVVVSGNVIRGYGDQAASTSGAIQLEFARSCVVAGNTMIEPSPNGIVLNSDCLDVALTGNVVQDAWSETFLSRHIRVQDDGVTGVVSGNLLSTGTRSATNRNSDGLIVVTGASGVSLALANNDFTAATAASVRDQTKTGLRGVRTITSTTTPTFSDSVLLCNPSSAMTVTLPSATLMGGADVTVKNLSTHTVVVTGNAIDGGTSYSLLTQYAVAALRSDSSQWWITGAR